MSTGNGQPEVLGEAPCSAGRDQDVHVEFENVDYQVTLSLDGKRLLGSTKDKYAPNIDALRRQEEMHIQPKAPVVAIAAEKQDCAIQHLKLWRDVYYTSPDSCSQGSDSHREAPHWASPSSDPPGIVLGNDEYFVLGDNSILSLDGRCWNEPIDLLQNENLQVASGRVPGRFMLGKAFFVYWPAGYRVPGVEFPLIPDFGDMRFIH